MTNTNELTAKAQATIGILENIAGYEPGDIDGDTVELRFENECGCDTGCDVSLVEQCQNAADVIRALTEALEAAEKHIAELETKSTHQDRLTAIRAIQLAAKLISERGQLRDRIASLEARTLTVKLEQYDEFWIEHIAPGCPDGYAKGFIDGRNYGEKQIKNACAAAGIKLQIEGE